MLSIDDLTTPLTVAQVRTSIYDVLAQIGVSTTSWKPGAVVRTMITACAVVLAAFSVLTAAIARSGFLEFSTGLWRTLVARYVYGVERIEATFATGTVTLTNTGGGVFAIDPEDLVVSNPTTGKTYRNTSAIALGALGTVDVEVVANEVGSDSTSTPGTITAIETTLVGVTVTNAASLVGQDEESDQALYVRCLEKLGALSPNGPWDAYSYVARNAVRAADGASIGVARTRPVKDGFGNVTLYVATATGGVTGTKTDPATDLGAIESAIQLQAAPLAVTAETASATEVPIAVTYSAWLYNTNGLTESQQSTAIALALSSFMTAQPIGGNVIGVANGKVFLDGLLAAIKGAIPEIFHVEITLPAADVELSVNEVPTLGTVTVTALVEEPPSDGF